jgi:hypothetical protein
MARLGESETAQNYSVVRLHSASAARSSAGTFFFRWYLTVWRFRVNIPCMTKAIGVTLLFLGVAGFALGSMCDCIQAPEVNFGAGGNALALLSGALLVFRSRKK